MLGQDHWEPVDQGLADAMCMAVQEAVRWFHDRNHMFLGDPGVRVIPDDEVRERIAGYQVVLDKEAQRVSMIDQDLLAYQLNQMPFERQRALVERWERLWNEGRNDGG